MARVRETYGIFLEVRIGHRELGILDLVHHLWVHIFNGDLVAGCGICDDFLCPVQPRFLLFVWHGFAGGCRLSLPFSLLLIQLAVPFGLVLIKVLDELLHRGDGVGAGVVPSWRVLLLSVRHGIEDRAAKV